MSIIHKSKYLYEIGDIIETKTGKIKLTSYIRMPNGTKHTRKGYKYICLKDKYEGSISESGVKKKQGCPLCCHNPQKIVAGINDMATTEPWMVDWLKYKDDSYNYMANSNKSIDFICKECGFEKKMTPNQFYRTGFGCNRCGDGISMPNKFVCSVLETTGVSFETEKSNFTWNKISKYRYDFYLQIDGCDYLIEVDGKQHFEKKSKNSAWGELEDIEENDRKKERLAHINGFELIRIDCRISEFNFMKNSIIKSRLSDVLDLGNMNWAKCFEYCQTSKVKEICEFHNQGYTSAIDVAKRVDLHYDTVLDYLKRGTILGWCDYNPKLESSKNGERNGKKSSKRVLCLDTGDVFESAKECERQSMFVFGVNLTQPNISSSCNKGHKTGGFRFKYFDEDINNIKTYHLNKETDKNKQDIYNVKLS